MDGLHLTLRFLGSNRSEPGCPRPGLRCWKRHPGVGPFELGLAGAGAFPSPTRPRVLWLGLGLGTDPLEELTIRLLDGPRRSRLAPR